MRKSTKNLAICVCVFVLAFLTMPLMADASNEISGVMGNSGGVTWTYNTDTKTLTMSGEDSGVCGNYDNGTYKSPFIDICGDVEIIKFENCKLKGSIKGLFGYLPNLEQVGFVGLDTSQVTDMSYLFQDCTALISLDLSNLNVSAVTDMSSMFNGCTSLSSLNVKGIDTSNVTSMSYMFKKCSSLICLDLSDFNTTKVESMSNMFESCSSLKSLNVSSFDTSNVTLMDYMFFRCRSLESLDVNNFNTSKVERMNYMFAMCESLTTLNVSNFVTTNVSLFMQMFYSCRQLKDLNISSFDFTSVQDESDIQLFLSWCNSLETINTPKSVNGFSIDLPYEFWDQAGNETKVISDSFCNKILTKEIILVSAITLYSESCVLQVGNTFPLGVSITVEPENASNKELLWESSDTSVVTVDEKGRATAVGPGTATVTVTAKDGSGVSASCEVLVPLLATDVTLNETSVKLKTGDEYSLTATVKPENATYKGVEWKSLDTKVVVIDHAGKMRAVGPGTATIVATAYGGSDASASCEVTVTQPVRYITLSETDTTIHIGKSKELIATPMPENASNKAVTWKSSNTSVATVDANGKVTAVSLGTATITVTAQDGSWRYANCKVTVTRPITEIVLSESNINLVVQDSETLTATVKPDNASNKALTWESSDTSVAVVDANGKVTAVASGNTTVTATAADGSGVSVSCKITVIEPMSEQEKQVRAFVERMYTVALGRVSDQSGIDYWADELLSHRADGSEISTGFIMSKEFNEKNYSNEEYLKVLYRTFFDREADKEGLSFWLKEMKAGRSRKSVLAGFVNSKEFTGICESYGITRGTMADDATATGAGQFVERLYTIAMERSSDPAGLEDWAKRINNKTNTPEQVAKEFFLSPEYAGKKTSNEKYVETLYLVFMDRTSEKDGKAYWVEQLNKGVSRESVLEGFADSEEFKEIMARYGL